MPENKRYKLIILEEASDDIYHLEKFYEEGNPGQGDVFLDNLGTCLARLEQNPFEWQYAKRRQDRIRRGIVSNPQAIFLYLVEGKEVRILSVKDVRSDWMSDL